MKFFQLRVFWVLSLAIVGLSLACLLDSFRQGIGYGDEAWVMLLIRNRQPALGTNFALYYRFLADWNIEYVRMFAAGMWLICWGVLSCAALHYFRKDLSLAFWQKCVLVLLICTISQLPWLEGAAPMPEYRQLSSFWCFTGFGFLLYGIDGEASPAARWFWLILSGIFFIQVPFTMAPLTVIAPFILLTLYWKNPRMLLPFVAGGIIGIAAFFLLVQSPQSFFGEIMYSTHAATHAAAGRHGIGMVISCYMKIILEYLTFLLPCGAALYGCSRLSNLSMRRWMLPAIVLVLIGGFMLESLRLIQWHCSGVPAFPVTYIAVLLVYCLLVHQETHPRDFRNAVIAWALLLPTALCTATDQGFGNRLTAFVPMMYLYVIILMLAFKDRLAVFLLNSFLILGLLAGCVYLKRSDAFRRHVVPTASVGLPYKGWVHSEKADLVRKILDVSKDCPYWATDEFAWDLALLANKKTLGLKRFRYYQYDDMAAMCKEKSLTAKDIVFVESNAHPLNATQLLEVQNALGASKLERIPVSSGLTVLRFAP